ncbi:cytoplasmic protein [Mycena metata]|uniref:Cytoplasmic protein n=1 Tax=Mycena metata TaxID=1033252 RepID=A0AAD7NS58_9AGAR|nr:cytoplasmic protein [Mycena metata]
MLARAFTRRFCLPRQTPQIHWRTYATPVQDIPDSDSPKKPRKSTTPLRRSASASLPIRVNPTPTRSSIQTVFTLATAERYLLSRIRTHPQLQSLGSSQKFHDAWWFSRWGKGKAAGEPGEVFVFANGSFVCWGLEEDEAHRFALEVIGGVPGIEVAPLRAPETEELEFVIDPIETTRLQGDLIILGQSPPLNEITPPTPYPPMSFPPETLFARYAFSQALSRSTALSALEVALDEYLSSMALLPLALAKSGKPGMGRTALVKKLGELMKFRQGLNLNRENFSDVPDFYWTEPELEKYFDSMSDALDVKVRTDSVNDKITYAAEAQSVLRQLLTETSTHSMELVIIALIAVEVVIALIRDGPELFGGGGAHHGPSATDQAQAELESVLRRTEAVLRKTEAESKPRPLTPTMQ